MTPDPGAEGAGPGGGPHLGKFCDFQISSDHLALGTTLEGLLPPPLPNPSERGTTRRGEGAEAPLPTLNESAAQAPGSEGFDSELARTYRLLDQLDALRESELRLAALQRIVR